MGPEGRGRLKNSKVVLWAMRGRFLRDLLRCESQKDSTHGANEMRQGPGVKPNSRDDEGGRHQSTSQVLDTVQRTHECELTEVSPQPGDAGAMLT